MTKINPKLLPQKVKRNNSYTIYFYENIVLNDTNANKRIKIKKLEKKNKELSTKIKSRDLTSYGNGSLLQF